jgi:hypothetical protein
LDGDGKADIRFQNTNVGDGSIYGWTNVVGREKTDRVKKSC